MGLMGMIGGRITKLPCLVIVINFIMENTHLYRVFTPLKAKDIHDFTNQRPRKKLRYIKEYFKHYSIYSKNGNNIS